MTSATVLSQLLLSEELALAFVRRSGPVTIRELADHLHVPVCVAEARLRNLARLVLVERCAGADGVWRWAVKHDPGLSDRHAP